MKSSILSNTNQPAVHLLVRVHLWDISGNEEYYDTRVELYNKTDGVIIVFDVTSQSSFDAVRRWIDEITKAIQPLPVIFLCGCKVASAKNLEVENSWCVSVTH